MRIISPPSALIFKRLNSSNTIDKNDRYVEKLEKHIEKAEEAMKYSSDRFDILIISLATGTLVLSVGSYAGLLAKIHIADNNLLKVGWLFMVAAILSNLLSQISGYLANEKDIQVSRQLIRIKRGKLINGNIVNLKKWCSRLNVSTLILNVLSMFILVAGMIALTFFYSNNI